MTLISKWMAAQHAAHKDVEITVIRKQKLVSNDIYAIFDMCRDYHEYVQEKHGYEKACSSNIYAVPARIAHTSIIKMYKVLFSQ